MPAGRPRRRVEEDMNGEPNQPDAVNPAIPRRFHIAGQLRGVTDPDRSAGIALAFTAGFATILGSEVAKRRERTR